MTHCIRLALCLLLGLALSSPLSAADREGVAPKLLTILTSDSSETQAMASILTMHHVRNGGGARVLFCDGAGELGVNDATMGSGVV